jgi:chitin disaccharide deacetylase
MTKKNLILCADDYAYTPENSKAIRNLLTKNKINATSCMTDTKYWPAEAKMLKLEINKIKKSPLIGLHFSLTEQTNSKYYIKSFFKNKNIGLLELLIRSKLRLISKKYIYQILEHQYNLFEKEFNQSPNFIDGHQHVHQFPVIRDALIKFYKNKKLKKSCFIRTTYPLYASKDKFKELIIKISGAKKFAKLIKNNNISTNNGFAGLYKINNKLDDKSNVNNNYKYFFEKIKNNSLIMCHPGIKNNKNILNNSDQIANRRVLEYQYFMSDEFTNHLKNSNIIIN